MPDHRHNGLCRIILHFGLFHRAFSSSVAMLAGFDASQLEDDMATVRVTLIFHRAMVGLTAVVMVTSELCACIMRPASTSVIYLLTPWRSAPLDLLQTTSHFYPSIYPLSLGCLQT